MGCACVAVLCAQQASSMIPAPKGEKKRPLSSFPSYQPSDLNGFGSSFPLSFGHCWFVSLRAPSIVGVTHKNSLLGVLASLEISRSYRHFPSLHPLVLAPFASFTFSMIPSLPPSQFCPAVMCVSMMESLSTSVGARSAALRMSLLVIFLERPLVRRNKSSCPCFEIRVLETFMWHDILSQRECVGSQITSARQA